MSRFPWNTIKTVKLDEKPMEGRIRQAMCKTTVGLRRKNRDFENF